ncbi:MAG TPA: glycoside hydrolase family 97 N-terminal domain-containing protein, partial [Chitinophagaceae bacterium]|nr:glycoside hydrolase family 97 N-terminal domain-containing protein [Chitinophagaceae bacterium]
MKKNKNETIKSKMLLAVLIMFAGSNTGFTQKSFQLFSPDSSIRLEIKTGEKLSYQLFASSDLLMSSSTADLQLDNGKKFSDKIVVTKSLYGRVNEIIDVPVPYRRKKVANSYSWLKLIFKEPFGIEFRLYNNGMAYRMETRFRDSINIERETAFFGLDPSAQVWFAGIDKRQNMDRFHTSFEAVYKKQSLVDIADTMLTFAPVTVSLPNNYHLAITDANLFDYPGMFLQKVQTGLQGVFAPYPLQEKLM